MCMFNRERERERERKRLTVVLTVMSSRFSVARVFSNSRTMAYIVQISTLYGEAMTAMLLAANRVSCMLIPR